MKIFAITEKQLAEIEKWYGPSSIKEAATKVLSDIKKSAKVVEGKKLIKLLWGNNFSLIKNEEEKLEAILDYLNE